MIGWAFRQLAIWVGLGLLLYAIIGQREFLVPHNDGGAVAAVAAPAAPPPSSIGNVLSYHADQRGHVVLDGVVNGANVRFLVDTGATLVALSLADAAAAGISRGSLVYNATMNTANGHARAALVTLREVRIGQLSLNDVAGVVQENLPYSLLGMSFLKRVDSWEMRDGVLTLNWQ